MISAKEAKEISEKNKKTTKGNREDSKKLETIYRNIKKACEKGKSSLSYNSYITEVMAKDLFKNGFKIEFSDYYKSKNLSYCFPQYEHTKYGKYIENRNYCCIIRW